MISLNKESRLRLFSTKRKRNNSKIDYHVKYFDSAMILANFTLKAQNFTVIPHKFVDFSIGLIIESDMIEAKIDRIISQFRSSFYEIFFLPISVIIIFTFIVGFM